LKELHAALIDLGGTITVPCHFKAIRVVVAQGDAIVCIAPIAELLKELHGALIEPSSAVGILCHALTILVQEA